MSSITGNQLYALRKGLHLGKGAFGRLLGIQGNNATIRRAIARAEGFHDRPISQDIEDMVNAAKDNEQAMVAGLG